MCVWRAPLSQLICAETHLESRAEPLIIARHYSYVDESFNIGDSTVFRTQADMNTLGDAAFTKPNRMSSCT